MKPERILLPLDVQRCPLEAFELANQLAARPEVTIILLQVIHLNVAVPDNRLYRELEEEARFYLQRLADEYLHPIVSTMVRVRMGDPALHILAEAQSQKADMIILPAYGLTLWQRIQALWKPGSNPALSALTERVIREAPCAVLVVQAQKCFNCERAWARPERESVHLEKTASPMAPSMH